ncbi:MAG: FAD-binding oxidoreductase [Brevinematia bacterium]
MRKLFQGIVEVNKVVSEAEDVVSLYFGIRDFEYEPGHFMMVSFPEEAEDKKKRRAYFIATSPTESEKDGLVGITVRFVEGGYLSRKFFDSSVMREGTKLFVAGPFGREVFEKKNLRRVVFFAGGSGIVPIRSAMKYVCDRMPNTKVILFYTFKTPKEFIYEGDVKDMLRNPRFKGFITVERVDGNHWKGLKGKITKDLVLDNISGDEDMFYACGSTQFVREIEEIVLKFLGVDRNKFKAEAWG